MPNMRNDKVILKFSNGMGRRMYLSAALVFGLLSGASAMAEVMPELAKKHECQSCHDMETRLVGPSLREVAKRYKRATKFSYEGKEYPLEAGLMMKVSMGGSGNWGSMPMPGSDLRGTQQGEIRALVRFVLGLEK